MNNSVYYFEEFLNVVNINVSDSFPVYIVINIIHGVMINIVKDTNGFLELENVRWHTLCACKDDVVTFMFSTNLLRE